MSQLPDEEVVLRLLEYAVARQLELSAGQGIALPPPDWTINGVQVPKDQRQRAVQMAADARYVKVTHIGHEPVPIELTAKGRSLVREWRS